MKTFANNWDQGNAIQNIELHLRYKFIGIPIIIISASTRIDDIFFIFRRTHIDHRYSVCKKSDMKGNKHDLIVYCHIDFDFQQLLQKHMYPIIKNRRNKLLFISYKFVKSFLAITFLLLVFSNLNFHDVCQRCFFI